MPLDNTAKLSDIIAALQTMEGINAKADLASVVGSPATASDTMAAINAVIQQAKNDLAAKLDNSSSGTESLQALIDKLFVGKKWASGVATAGNTSQYFTTANGSKSINSYAVTVNGLTFKPSQIFIYAPYSTVGIYTHYLRDRKIGGYVNGDIMTGQTTSDGSIGSSYGVSSAGQYIVITETSFTLPFYASAINQACSWVAIE